MLIFFCFFFATLDAKDPTAYTPVTKHTLSTNFHIFKNQSVIPVVISCLGFPLVLWPGLIGFRLIYTSNYNATILEPGLDASNFLTS